MENTKVRECKHGTFEFFPDDEFVGRSLDLYGEYSEHEVDALAKMLQPGDVVVEVGANIGALTIPMARMVEPEGTVYAFEPQPENAALLGRNVSANQATTVYLIGSAASDDEGTRYMPHLWELEHKNYGDVEVGQKGSCTIKLMRIDSLSLKRLKLLKIDAQGHEMEVLRGAAKTIARCKPIIYCENDVPAKCQALVSLLVDIGYRCYWHRPPLWNPKNHFNNIRNAFGGIVSLNMVCVPEDSKIEVKSLDEVADLRPDSAMYLREIERHRRTVKKNPDDLEARVKQAHYCNLMQWNDDARVLLFENLEWSKLHVPSRAVLALMDLQEKKWRTGWAGYELRYEQPTSAGFGNRPRDGYRWQGSYTDEPVLLWSEQGFGDSIMFARFIKRALEYAPNLFVEVQPQLYELFETSKLVPPGRLFRLGRTMPKYGYHCALPSLPYALDCNTDVDIVSGPYLHVDPAMRQSWLKRGTPKIGICCSGSPRSERSYSRDIDPAWTDELARDYGPFLQLEQQGQFESFADTAAAIAALDLVITVDTSIAHLAGALGIPTWLLLSYDPDWRWGLKSTSSIWYRSVRIFRQPRLMDWAPVIAEVARELEKRVASKAA